MTRHGPPATVDDDLVWVAASTDDRCPVCAGADGCGRTDDGAFAVCMRVLSERPVDAGGWLHALPRRRE